MNSMLWLTGSHTATTPQFDGGQYNFPFPPAAMPSNRPYTNTPGWSNMLPMCHAPSACANGQYSVCIERETMHVAILVGNNGGILLPEHAVA